jgi:uncharacterized protein (TIGR02597 family)
MKCCKRILLAGALLLAAARAQDTSDPVGAFRIRLRGNSDTVVSLPLHRPALIESALSTRTGSALELSATLPTLPTEGAFALVMSGALEGAVLPIASISGRVATIGATSYDLSGLKTEVTNGLALADLIAIVPYWTLDTLFPLGRGVNISPDSADRKTEILIFDDTIPGTNLSASAMYFYYAGGGSIAAGWYAIGNSTPQGNLRLPPNHYFVVRHHLPADTELILTGGVQMAGFRVPVATRAANRDQDNLVALPVPTAVTLSASRLIESGAFAASPDGAARRDELLVFDNTRTGFNNAASAIYFYISGNPAITTGWYKVGDPTQTYGNVLLKPGEGYVVRKRASVTPAQQVWNGIPAYLQ